MHGTGTPLGDPIEVNAALAVLRRTVTSVQFSAAKSRVGHAEAAAGGVGMVQVSYIQRNASTSTFNMYTVISWKPILI